MSRLQSETDIIRVQLLSDLHAEFVPGAAVLSADECATDADVAIIAGDIARAPDAVQSAAAIFPRTEAVVLVGGNHEHYDSGLTIDEGLAAMHRAAEGLSSAEGRDVIMLENEVRVVRIRDTPVRLIGCTLWTDYALFGDPVRDRMSVERALTDYRLIKGRVSRPLRAFLGDFDTLTTSEVLSRFDASRAFLEDALTEPFDGPTIVVTHHLPSLRSVAKRFRDAPVSAGFASNLDDLVDRGSTLWVHGHTHDSCLWRSDGGTLVACNPAGYPRQGGRRQENDRFDPKLVFVMRRVAASDRWRADVENQQPPAGCPETCGVVLPTHRMRPCRHG